MFARHGIRTVLSAALVLLLSLLMLPATEQAAYAVATSGKVRTTVAPAGSAMRGTYTIGQFKSAKNETVTGYQITFPVGVDPTGATSAGNTVSVAGRVVTVTYGTPIGGNQRFSVSVGNVRNPTTAGTYAIARVTFFLAGGGTSNVNLSAAEGQFTIFASPYLQLIIETSGDLQVADFGTVDPGTPSPSDTVTVTVDSSNPFTITRTFSGSAAAMGISGTGIPAGVQPAGLATFLDVLRLTPPYTTNPDVALTSNITYTVVQQ